MNQREVFDKENIKAGLSNTLLTNSIIPKMKSIKLTVAQATIEFLKNQFSERDGVEQPFFAGCFGIFGHGNLAGLGQALQQSPDFRYYLVRNKLA